jgi:hypothetical protein
MTTITKVRRMRTNARHGEYARAIERAVESKSNHFRLLNVYGNPNSAQTIRWMVENGKGLRAFEQYAPGTFQAVIRNDVEVWFRLA